MLDLERRQFITLLGGATVSWPLATRAQQATRVYRLGLLSPTSGPTPNHKALDDALTALGYREGQNLIVERRYSAGNDRLPILAAELGSRLIKSTIQEQRRGRQRPGNFARAYRTGLRCA
jgi:putative tryptophan/tyrosine transport system substrate-binding protein